MLNSTLWLYEIPLLYTIASWGRINYLTLTWNRWTAQYFTLDTEIIFNTYHYFLVLCLILKTSGFLALKPCCACCKLLFSSPPDHFAWPRCLYSKPEKSLPVQRDVLTSLHLTNNPLDSLPSMYWYVRVATVAHKWQTSSNK